jgi:hypothetical protein
MNGLPKETFRDFVFSKKTQYTNPFDIVNSGIQRFYFDTRSGNFNLFFAGRVHTAITFFSQMKVSLCLAIC